MAPSAKVHLHWHLATERGSCVGKAADAIQMVQKIINRQQAGQFTLQEAAALLARAHGLDAADFLTTRLLPACATGQLLLVDPKDGGPVSGRAVRDFHDWVTSDNLDRWLEAAGFPFRWPVQKPKAAVASADAVGMRYDLLASPEELVAAFGKFTGITVEKFSASAIKESSRLLAARKVVGMGGHRPTPPLLCPYEVMQWLVDPRTRGLPPGRPRLSKQTAWRMLEAHFPKVYEAHSSEDPRQFDGG